MATQSSENNRLSALRSSIEVVYIPLFKEFLRETETIKKKHLPSDEASAALIITFNKFFGQGKFTEIHDATVKEVQLLDCVQKSGSLQTIWNNELQKGADEFFTQKNFTESTAPESLYTYLLLSSVVITGYLELANQSTERTTTPASSATSTTQPITPTPEKNSSTQESASDLIAQKARSEQKESLRRKKRAYALERLKQINGNFGKNQLDDRSLKNLERIIELSALSGVDIDTLFYQYGLTDALGPLDATTLSALKSYAGDIRNEFGILNAEEGLSKNVFHSNDPQINSDLHNSLLLMGRAGKDDIIPLAYGANLQTIRSRAENKDDVVATEALNVYEQTIEQLWNPNQGTVKGTLNNLTGKTRREQEVMLAEWGVSSKPDEVHPKNSSEVMSRLDDKALLDLLGMSPEDTRQPSYTPDQVAPSFEPTEQRRKNNQLKIVGDVAKNIASTPLSLPVKIGAATAGAGVGTFVYGFLSQAPGLMVAGGALTGAGIGGSVGFLVGGPLGGLIGTIGGGIIGGGASYIAGKAIFGGAAVSASTSTLAAAGGQAATGIATNITPIASHGITQGAAITSNALTGANAFLQSLSSLPSLFSSAFSTGALVTGPLVTAGAVAASGVIILTASYLLPSSKTTSLPGVCWPTDGQIWVLETYPESNPFGPAGTSHATFEGGDPMDIVPIPSGTHTDIYTPFSGTATAYVGAGGANMVRVETTQGFTVLFAHLDVLLFPPDQPFSITKGTLIGHMGDTGLADGVHLHYEVIGKKLSEIVPPTPPLARLSVVSHTQCSAGTGNSAQKQCFKDAPNVVDKAKKIAFGDPEGSDNKLYPGVWGNFNYSPQYPQHAVFSKPPGVTDFFYDVIVGGARAIIGLEAWQPDDLFWCAWMVTYAYREATPPILAPSSASVEGHHRNWQKDGKIIKNVGEMRPGDLPLGSIIAFDKNWSAANTETDAHIAVLCDKKFDESGENGTLISCESNNGSPSNNYNVINGQIQDLPVGFKATDKYPSLTATWFGLPPQDDPSGKCGP